MCRGCLAQAHAPVPELAPVAAVDLCISDSPQACEEKSQSGNAFLCVHGCGVIPLPRHVTQAGPCGKCGVHRRSGARAWVCGVCAIGVCPKCHRTGHRWAASQDLARAVAPESHLGEGAADEADGAHRLDIADLFAEAVNGPALTTILRVPKLFDKRLGDLLKQCLLDDVNAQREYARAQSSINEATATMATQRLWLLPTLALRINGLGVDDGKQQTKLLRGRFQLLEKGDWQTLLEQYVEEKRDVERQRESAAVTNDTMDRDTSTAKRHERFTVQAMRAKIAVARGVLEGKCKAAPSETTAQFVADLVAAQAPDTEDNDLEEALALAKLEAGKASKA
jgi:hypothetical protein